MTTKKPILPRLLAVVFLLGSAQAQILTVDEAERLALERPETRALIDASVANAEGNLVSARTWRNPVFAYDREGVDGFGGDDAENTYQLEREFDFSGRRALQRRSAEAALSAARHDSIATEAELKAEVARRFYNVLSAEEQLASLIKLSDTLGNLQRSTTARANAGDASRYDNERVKQEALRAAPMLAEAEADLIAARRQLGALIGPEAMGHYAELSGTILPDEALVTARTTSELSPRLAALAADAEAANYSARAEARGAVPEVTLGAGVRTFEGPSDETGLLFSLSMPLPVFDRNQGEKRAAAARARQAEARYRLESDAIEAELASLFERARRLQVAARVYRNEAVASAETLRRVGLISYDAGEISVFEVLDALNAATEAELRAVTLDLNAREALIKLNELLPETE